MPKSSERLNRLPTYFFAIIGQRIQEMQKQGIDIISLDIGSPDLPPPQNVVDTLAEWANKPNTHGYTGYRGTPSFRQAVATYYARRFGVNLDPEKEILPLIGSKEGIVNLSLAYLDPGDLALVPDVGYPSYSMGARLAGADVHWLPVNEDNEFKPSLHKVPEAVANEAKILWINYPNNPTGATAELEDYAKMVDFCRRHDILLASDNPYVDVTFDGYRAHSVLEVADARDCTIEFMSMSKTYNMGGWRLGAAVGNIEAIRLLLQVKSNVDSGHFRPMYEAGVTALEETPDSWISSRNAVYQQRRDRILEILPRIGLTAAKSKGSLYLWAKVHEGTGAEYVEQALTHAHVAFAPGSAYGPGGDSYVRISLGIPDTRLEVALERLVNWYGTRK